ncbi:zinc finger protein 557-like isoform X1 [Pieris brassicae]|uniref:zinc finger protein 557-like isoform X1 n=2 Tax=Pieris brassicae TaxID=7116 RepID=UPI001E65FE88|nr:zinc finger protein 557-like isoform X1 [Pieris brassicae]
MHTLKCCRFCLNTKNLHLIFTYPEHNEKYTNILFNIAGIQIKMNDELPHEICSNCIKFINESIQFRQNCENAENILNNFKVDDPIPQPFIIKTAEHTSINIAHTNVDFNDFDDNVTLDTLRVKNIQCESDESRIENLEPLRKGRQSTARKKNVRNIKISVKESNDQKKDTREEIECEYCHKILTSKLSLRNHYKIHTGFDVVCEHCGKKFITRRLLLMHCRAKHGYEKTDKCSYCDYKASNAEQVKIHERLHTGEKPYVCKECNAGFHRKSSYLQHIAIHLPEKTVQCDQCPAWFKSVTLMRIHKNRHRAPQYRYKCGVCDNSFARRRNAARHLQRVHGVPPDHHIHRHNIH